MSLYKYEGIDRTGNFIGGFIDGETKLDAILELKDEYDVVLITYFGKISNINFLNGIRVSLNEKRIQLKNEQMKKKELEEIKKQDKAIKEYEKENNMSKEINTSTENKNQKSDKKSFINISIGSFGGKNKNKMKSEDNFDIFNNPNKFLDGNESIYNESQKDNDEDKPNIQKRFRKDKSNETKLNWDLLNEADFTYDVKKNLKIKIKEKEIIMFSRKLSIMLNSGVSLVKALMLIEETSDKKLRYIIKNITEDIQSGNSLSASLAKYPRQFDTNYVAMISIGENSGNLGKCLTDIVEFKEKNLKTKKKLVTATIYPAVIFVLLILILLAASIFFIPMFKKTFLDQGTPFPRFSEIVFNIVDSVPYILLVSVIVVIGIIFLRRSNKRFDNLYKATIDNILLKTPVVKTVLCNSYMFSFTSTLSLMLKNGIRLKDALDLSKRTIKNVYIKQEIEDISALMLQGHTFSEALKAQKHFDKVLTGIVLTGEESGKMDDVLKEVSIYYSEELSRSIDMITELMQPIAMILIAVLAAPIIVAVYLPILDISSGTGAL